MEDNKKTGNTKNIIKLSLVILAAAVLTVGLYIYYNNSNSRLQLESSSKDRTLSEDGNNDFELEDLEGNMIKLSDYEDKIVVLNFWASWCAPCRIEMPDFDELDKEFKKGNDVVLLAVNVGEDKGTVERFMSENDYNLKVLLDKDAKIHDSYGVRGLPTTYFINKDGSLYDERIGMVNKEYILSVVEKMMEE